MRILMYGWEFPPLVSGGLGTACEGMTRALVALGHEVVFVLPRIEGTRHSPVRLLSASDTGGGESGTAEGFAGLLIHPVVSRLRPYLPCALAWKDGRLSDGAAGESAEASGLTGQYGPNLLAEVCRYGAAAGSLAATAACDVIHAHDWMTVFAGLEARRRTGKPLVLHMHALECDRSGERINEDVHAIERFGMEQADAVIAVSQYTKERIVARYGIDPAKITVVHNAVTRREGRRALRLEKDPCRKTVLFLGRITFQKGPDYFVEAAARVLKEVPETTFLMAGAGDMLPPLVERVAELGMGERFHFTGFLDPAEVERAYARSDVYVMPSVSEPFGIAPLEAMLYDVPVIISKQSGVAEVVRHVLKADFWDVAALANQIIAVLRRPALVKELLARSREEIRHIRWERAAVRIVQVYARACGQ